MKKRFDTLDGDRVAGWKVPESLNNLHEAELLLSLEIPTSGLAYLRAKHTSILFKS